MTFRKGDEVSWATSQGTTHGVVEEKRTSEFQFKKQTFNASDDEPYYIVKSEKSSDSAAHKESALSRRSATPVGGVETGSSRGFPRR